MKLNFKEYIQKKKFLDIFCYVFCAFYLFFVVCLAANETQLKANIQKEINNMLLQASIVNKKI